MMDNFHLLGSSQTFIGILTTLVGLCIISGNGSGNFLYAIISKITERTEKVVSDLNSETITSTSETDFGSLRNRFNSLIERYKEKRSHKEPSLQDKITQYLEKQTIVFQMMWNDYSSEFSKKYFQPIFSKIKEVKNSNEQTYSPLYVFGYCFVIFLCDELCESAPSIIQFISRFIIFFTSISFVFLGFIWYKFHKEYQDFNSFKENNDLSSLSVFMAKGKDLLVLLLYLISTIIYASLAFDLINRTSSVIAAIIIFIACIGIFLLIGKTHIRVKKVYGFYNHSFLFYHFCVILLLSLFVAYILGYTLPGHNGFITYPDSLLIYMKWGMIVFILFYGILAPFLFPFRANKHIERYANDCRNKGKVTIKEEWTKINIWLDGFEKGLED